MVQLRRILVLLLLGLITVTLTISCYLHFIKKADKQPQEYNKGRVYFWEDLFDKPYWSPTNEDIQLAEALLDSDDATRTKAFNTVVDLGLNAYPVLYSLYNFTSPFIWAPPSSDDYDPDIEYVSHWASLREKYRDKSEDIAKVNEGIIKGLGKIIIPALNEAIVSKNPCDRAFGYWAIEKIIPEAADAIPALIRSLPLSDPFSTCAPSPHTVSQILSQFPVEIVLNPLIEVATSQDDVYIRAGAVNAIGIMGSQAQEALPTLIKALDDKEQFLREKLITAIFQVSPDGQVAIPVFTKLLKDNDRDISIQAARYLGEYGDKAEKALPDIIELYKNSGYYEDLAGVIGKFGSAAKAAVPALILALSDADSTKRLGALSALTKIGPAPGVVPALLKIFKDEHDYNRLEVTRSISKFGPQPGVVDALISALDDKSNNVRGAAYKALADLGPASKKAIPRLLEILRNDVGKNDNVGDTIGAIGITPGLVDSLVSLFENKNYFVRRNSAYVLGKLGRTAEKAIPSLKGLLTDQEPYVRLHAAIALSEIVPGSQDAVDTLIKLLDVWPVPERSYAIKRLGEMGSFAEKALQRLKEMETSNFGQWTSLTHRLAEEAIAKIEGTWVEGEQEEVMVPFGS